MTFYFYDLETSGFSPKDARIMQFAGQRTDMDLKPIGEPHNVLIKMTDDVVPDPCAILITGITPQATIADGITEAEFLRLFTDEIATKDTVLVGYNTIRFDDEFMRYLHYRNFYDPYEWQWQDGRSRWDLLDLVRMTRALRPDGIKWPFDSTGKPANRLELLAAVNKLDHANAHDALSDVLASIALARLIKNKQPKLFDFLFSMRTKQKVQELVSAKQPFVYTSGKYASEHEKTTVVATIVQLPNNQGALVYDLRYDPDSFAKLTPAELVEVWRWKKDDPSPRLPVKTLKYNRCPAVAPLSVLDEAAIGRLNLNMGEVQHNYKKLSTMKDWVQKVVEALSLLEKQQQTRFLEDQQSVDSQLYDGFFNEEDRNKLRVVRASDPGEFDKLNLQFKDGRLAALLPLYKARNFSKQLTSEEKATWEAFRTQKLLTGGEKSPLAQYFALISEIEQKGGLTSSQKYLLEELQLYGQSIMPTGEDF